MKTQSVKEIMKLKEWATNVNEQRNSGQSVREWCNAHGIAVKTYYYRQNRVREAIIDATETNGELARIIDKYTLSGQKKIEFVELSMPQNNTAVTVQIKEYISHIQNGADSEMIKCVLKTLAQI